MEMIYRGKNGKMKEKCVEARAQNVDTALSPYRCIVYSLFLCNTKSINTRSSLFIRFIY